MAIVDFTNLATPEGRAQLAHQVRDGMREHGFLYVINHGLNQEQVRYLVLTERLFRLMIHGQNNRIFDIANACFTSVGDEEKRSLQGKVDETGAFGGYKLRNYWVSLFSLTSKCASGR